MYSMQVANRQRKSCQETLPRQQRLQAYPDRGAELQAYLNTPEYAGRNAG
jgi:hypothetical protein